ncbi:hypothetical protein [Paenibacillus herberti]|nr:hypothetical protein [Paenibacillus herberti]
MKVQERLYNMIGWMSFLIVVVIAGMMLYHMMKFISSMRKPA